MRGYNISNADPNYKLEEYLRDVKTNLDIKLPKNFYIYKDTFKLNGLFNKTESSIKIWSENKLVQQYPFFILLHEIGHCICHNSENILYELALFVPYLELTGVSVEDIDLNDLQEVYADTFAMFYLKTFNKENEIIQLYMPIVEKYFKHMYDYFRHLLKEDK